MTITLETREAHPLEAHDAHETDEAHGLRVDMHLDLGNCGMGMAVIRSWQAIQQLAVGGILHMSSSHPCAESDITAWCNRSGQRLLSIVADGPARQFTIQRLH